MWENVTSLESYMFTATFETQSVLTSQWTNLRRFAIDSTSKLHVESSSRFHWFWKANPRGNHYIDSTWKFQRGFHSQNRRNIDEFSTWIFLCCFDVELTYCFTRCFQSIIFELFLLWKPIPLHKKMKFSVKDFFNKCDQIRRKLRIWSHLLKKSSMENLIFRAVF